MEFENSSSIHVVYLTELWLNMFKMDSFLENKDFYRKKCTLHATYFSYFYIYIYKYKNIHVSTSFFLLYTRSLVKKINILFDCVYLIIKEEINFHASIFDTSHFSQEITTTYYSIPLYNNLTNATIKKIPRIMKHIPRLQFKSKQKIFTRCVPHNVTYNHRLLNYSISCKDQATTKKKKNSIKKIYPMPTILG